MRSTHVVGDVEGVGVLARRVVRVVVERVEVVVDGARPRGPRRRRSPARGRRPRSRAGSAVIRCRRPTARRRVAGQRDVDAVLGQPRVELAGVELRRARLEQRLERLARLVGRLAHRPALLRRQVAHAAQQLGQLGLAPEEAHAQLLQLGRRRRRRAIAASASARSCCDPVEHQSADPSQLVQRDGGGHGGVQRLGGDRDVGDAVAGRHDVGRQPLPLGADEQRHLAVGRPAQRLALVRHERHALARQVRRLRRGATGTAKIAPMLARTALGPKGSAQPGPSTTVAAPNASGAAQHRADVARVARRRAGRRRAGPAALRPALLVDRRAPACPIPACDTPASTSGSTSMPSSPLPAAQ